MSGGGEWDPSAPVIAVVGASDASGELVALARSVGGLLAARGATVVTGGLGGVMEAASRGAAEAGGLTVGILPGADRREANPFVRVAIATGMGELRNGLIVRTADALVAVGGGHGTLSEVALALRAGKRVVGLAFAFDVPGVERAETAEDAVARVLAR